MVMESKARITAIGAYVPEKQLSNFDLERMVDTSDDWIVQRTGIKMRYITGENEFASDLAVKAALDLQESSGKDLSDVDYIIVASFSPDHFTPSIASIIHGALNLRAEVGVLDINAACAGFVQGLFVANSFITVGLARKVLVIGAEALSKIVDYSDRDTCVLFGDGAGAALVEYDPEHKGFLSYHYGADGINGHKLVCTALAGRANGNGSNGHYLKQDGRGVYNFVIKNIPDAVKELAERAEMRLEDVDWFVPHSANLRMIDSLRTKLLIPQEKTLTSVELYGNTSAASIPLALWLAKREGKLKPGDTLALCGFGGGLNHAGLMVRL